MTHSIPNIIWYIKKIKVVIFQYLGVIEHDVYTGVSKWAGTFTRLRSCIVPEEITEPPKISGGENHKYDGR
jgi:hypothetical protein